MSERYEVNAPRIIHEGLGTEIVAIDLGSGAYFSMRGTAAVVWGALLAGRTTEEAVDHVRATHTDIDADVAAEVGAFVDDLVARELLVVADEREVGEPAGVGDGLDYTTPVIEVFTDMADVILLDPVHDVDSTAGWPHAAEGG